jgi:hypothetical protein
MRTLGATGMQGIVLSPDEPAPTGTAVRYSGDTVWFRLAAVKGTTYELEVELGTLSDSVLTLLDPDMEPQDFRHPTKSLQQWTCNGTSGTYFVSVAGTDDATGTFDIWLRGGGLSPWLGFPVEADTMTGAGTVIHSSTETLQESAYSCVADTECEGGTSSCTNAYEEGTMDPPYESWTKATNCTSEIANSPVGLMVFCQEDQYGKGCQNACGHCEEDSAPKHGVCKNKGGAFQCECHMPWFGQICTQNRCDEGSHTICQNEGYLPGCETTQDMSGPTPWECVCVGGFSGEHCQNQELRYAGETVWFKIEVNQVMAGTTYEIAVNLETLAGALLVIMDQDATTEVTRASKNGISAGLKWTFNASGTYFISVAAVGEETGTFALAVRTLGVVPTQSIALAEHDSVTTTLLYTGATVWFQLAAQNGTKYSLQVELVTLQSAKLALLDQDGTTQLTQSSGRNDRVVGLDWACTAPGPYYISVTGLGKATGTFTIWMRTIGASHGIVLSPDEPAPTGTVVRYSGDTVWFRLAAVKGTTYELEVELGTLSDSVLTLLDADGTTELMRNDDADATVSLSLLKWTCGESGTYFISVAGFRGALGTFRLAVYTVNDEPCIRGGAVLWLAGAAEPYTLLRAPESLTVSGTRDERVDTRVRLGCNRELNGEFELQLAPFNGKPYWKTRLAPESIFLYWSPSPTPRWYLDDDTDMIASLANVSSIASMPPSDGWHEHCDGVWEASPQLSVAVTKSDNPDAVKDDIECVWKVECGCGTPAVHVMTFIEGIMSSACRAVLKPINDSYIPGECSSPHDQGVITGGLQNGELSHACKKAIPNPECANPADLQVINEHFSLQLFYGQYAHGEPAEKMEGTASYTPHHEDNYSAPLGTRAMIIQYTGIGSNGFVAQVFCRNQPVFVDQCRSCPFGEHRINESDKPSCEVCPAEAICPGGVGVAATLTMCPAGQEPEPLYRKTCVSCPVGKYSKGAESCAPCLTNQEPNSNQTDCHCANGFYDRHVHGVVRCAIIDHEMHARTPVNETSCIPCPIRWNDEPTCVECDDTLHIRPGHARALVDRQDVEIFRCPDDVDTDIDSTQTVCQRTTIESGYLCSVGHTGPLCHVCATGYSRSGYRCTRCHAWSFVGASALACFIALIAGVIWLVLAKKQKLKRTLVHEHEISELSNPMLDTDAESVWDQIGADSSDRFGTKFYRRYWALGQTTVQPCRILIGFAQIAAQLGQVLHMEYPPYMTAMIELVRPLLADLRGILVHLDCIGLGGAHRKFILHVFILPLLFLLVVFVRYIWQRRSSLDNARAQLSSNIFIIIFLCYPSICNHAFGMFNCRLLADNLVVLEDDYSTRCDTGTHKLYKFIAGAVIVVVAFGIPGGFTVALVSKAREIDTVEVNKIAGTVAVQMSVSQSEAGDVIREVTIAKDYGFLLRAYGPRHYCFENFDMLRKLLLVGVLVVVDRGSVAQIAFAACLSFLFSVLHFRMWPYKLHFDNL